MAFPSWQKAWEAWEGTSPLAPCDLPQTLSFHWDPRCLKPKPWDRAKDKRKKRCWRPPPRHPLITYKSGSSHPPLLWTQERQSDPSLTPDGITTAPVSDMAVRAASQVSMPQVLIYPSTSGQFQLLPAATLCQLQDWLENRKQWTYPTLFCPAHRHAKPLLT